jgi:putative FmdB family regulatory protein
MPFYEYECQACGAHLEAMQKMSDAPLKTCPECRKPKLVRLISAPVFRLKGGGWYETDFKSDKENKRNLAGGEDKPAGDSEASTRRKAAKKSDSAAVKAKSAPAKPKAAAKSKSPARAKAKAKSKSKTAKPQKAKTTVGAAKPASGSKASPVSKTRQKKSAKPAPARRSASKA